MTVQQSLEMKKVSGRIRNLLTETETAAGELVNSYIRVAPGASVS